MNLNKILILIALLSFSCKKEIDVNLPVKNSKLVIEGTIAPFIFPEGKLNSLKITQSFSILNKPKDLLVKNAEITLLKNNQIFAVSDFIDSLGLYTFNYPFGKGPAIGDTFELTIAAPNFETVISKSYIPSKVLIDTFIIKPLVSFSKLMHPISEIELTFTDPSSEENFYEIIVTDIFGIYDFENYKKLQTNDASVTLEPYYPPKERFDLNMPNRLLFRDNKFNGQTKTIRFNYYPTFSFESGVSLINSHFLTIQLRNVTKDYFLFYSSSLQNSNNQREDILYGNPEPLNVFSNIKNGYGIFSGFNLDIKQVLMPEIILDL
jgi:hypothetical protein